MADNFRFVQAQNFTLAGAGSIIGETSIVLSSMTQINGSTLLTMTDFGAIGYGTIEPNSGTQEEQISFSGITQNGNGTATLTGVKTVLFTAPYTETSGLAKTHAGGTTFIISNTSGFYNTLTDKANDETVTGLWNFPNNGNTPTLGTVYAAPTTDLQIPSKKYVDDQITSGAPLMGLTTKGIAEEATQAEIDAGTQTGGTGAELAVNPKYLKDSIYYTQLTSAGEKAANAGDNTDIAVGSGNKFITQTGLQKAAEVYAASAAGTDTYAITLSPVPTSLVNGMRVKFKTDVANTGAATLNVNGIAAVALVTGLSTALATGDILANQVVEVVYNSTGPVWQVINPASAILVAPVYKNGVITRAGDSANGAVTTAHGLGVIPKYIRITARKSPSTSTGAWSDGVYNGTTISCTHLCGGITAGHWDGAGTSSTNIVYINDAPASNGNYQVAVPTFDSTNITLTWTKTGSPGSANIQIMWEAFA